MAGVHGEFRTFQEGSLPPQLEGTVPFFNYTRFPHFILSHQRRRMPTLSPGREPAWKVPVAGRVLSYSKSGCCLSVHLSVDPAHSQGRVWPGGCSLGPCPGQVQDGALGIPAGMHLPQASTSAVRAHLLTPNCRFSVSVLALQREGRVSGPGQRPSVTQCQPWPLWLSAGCCLRWPVLRHPLPGSPHAFWGGAYTAAQPKL